MKPLLPTLREKKRYIVFEVLSETPLKNSRGISAAIMHAVKKLLGELQSSKAGLELLEHWKGQRGIIRVNREYVNQVRAAFTFITQIERVPLIVRSVGVSGILNKAEKKFM